MTAWIKRSFAYGFWLMLRQAQMNERHVELLKRQIALQKKMIESLERENARLKGERQLEQSGNG